MGRGAKHIMNEQRARRRPDSTLPRPEAFIVFVTLSLGSSLTLAQPRATEPGPPAPRARIESPRLVVSEIFADPLLLEDRAGEFVEVANLGDRLTSLAGVQLVLPSGRSLALALPAGSSLQRGGVLVLRPMANHKGGHHLPGLRLPNRAGRLELRWRGRVLDVAQWTPRWPWPKHRPGRSLERRSPEADGRVGRSWRQSPRAYHGVERADPGRLPASWQRWLAKQKGRN